MRRWLGPGVLVAVGYMDPGNWATGIEAGSAYGYKLGWVILLSSGAAILLQIAAARLGLATQTDLVGLGYKFFGARVGHFLAFTAFVAVVATDLAEVLGFALALHLLVGLPLGVGAVLALVETVLVLYWAQRRPILLEALIGTLTLTILGIFVYEFWLLRPPMKAILYGFLPSDLVWRDVEALYLALGLVGATIMPHNLYLHSGWVRGRFPGPLASQFQHTTCDTIRSLLMAFFVNASLLITAATLSRASEGLGVRWGIQEAYRLLVPAVGSAASIAFGIALLLSGHNATLTTTLTGQIVLEYLLPRTFSPHARSFLLRISSLLPALIAILVWGETHLSDILVFSQVLLSLQLPFVLLPMLYFLHKIPQAQWSGGLSLLTYVISFSIVGLNLYLLLRL
ncbi:MAG: Nramp family divalent metal transporter [Bacteroidia bacterium]|nr:Nramp family divalent metal transporter [Bacteroidia bacterium]MDW8089342.1 Nramp family divalent metal transporter [Bacteroidia bacterium]